jgi:hypothetical protein
MWRILKFGLIAIGVVLLVGAGLVVGMRLHFSPSPPAVHYVAPKDQLEAQRQDLGLFRETAGDGYFLFIRAARGSEKAAAGFA